MGIISKLIKKKKKKRKQKKVEMKYVFYMKIK